MPTRRDFAVWRASLLVALGLLATSCDAKSELMLKVTGGGQLQILGTSETCASSCSIEVDVPASYSITAVPDPGWSFAIWGPDGGCASTFCRIRTRT